MKSDKCILGLIMVLFMLFPYYLVRFIINRDEMARSIWASLIITGTILIIMYFIYNPTIREKK